MKNIVFCEWCKEEIKKGQKSAGMHTYNFPQLIDERYFHFDCFIEWRDNRIKEAAEKVGKKAMKNAMDTIKPMIKGIINNEEETNKSDLQEVWVG